MTSITSPIAGSRPAQHRDDSVRSCYWRYIESRAAFEKLGPLLRRENPKESEMLDEVIKNWYYAIVDTALAFTDPVNFTKNNKPIEPIDMEIIFMISELASDLIEGSLNPTVRRLFFSPGRPGLSSIPRRCIDTAVRYVFAARCGIVNQPRVTAKVASLYGVAENTVYRWCQKRSVDQRFLQERSELDRKNLAEALERHLLHSADIYRQRRHLKARSPAKPE